MVDNLFLDDIEPIDEYYLMVRDCQRQEILDGKLYMEHLWEIYHEYADKDFPKKLTEDFHARFWEMYLTCTLLNKSFKLRPKSTISAGPDICI
jgi:hypothetical protein